MVGLPVTLPIPTEAATASYSFTDIANGQGYSTFFGLFTAAAGAGTYNLIETALVCGGSVVPANRRLNNQIRDFDTSTFNLPRVVKGTAYISGEAASSGTGSITTTIIHYDGSSETTIGAATSTPNFSNGTNGVFIAISLTETIFKKGDLVRVRMSVGNCGAGVHGFFVDPVGDYGMEPFKVLIPFKIDL
tara:strand:+ start:261 stop:830 length:570 start_codon:yes stop_codon:yes gene_type:complete